MNNKEFLLENKEFICSIILITFVIIFFSFKNKDVVRVKSNIDNKEYLVRDLPDKQEAANMLSRLNKILLHLMLVLAETAKKKIVF
jgi:hypothetical protein